MSDDAHSVVVFNVSDQPFAASVEYVAEVVPIPWLAKPPGMPSIVQGILNLGGVAVTVLRADLLLGLEPFSVGLDSSILIMKERAVPMGLLVQHVDGVYPLSACRVLPIDETRTFQGCVEAQLEIGEQAIPLLSWPKILLEEERQRVLDYLGQMSKRLDDLAEELS
ncbi:Chemotaxis signal transduction protein [Magnetospirillum sp. LM-5]|uniref:chemotaxis protein CheW n=1 Tax=Magnetospirillum sp. LM-5 TaxID=2681466 RepID=UPI00138412D6|nr:chemotaxis protein CheW [Magnetospirillum sp. LM-5]CAA7612008.1 Chemotaxis signal transduction protein [Magnetospirillum sp. LM-5]